MKFAVEIPHGKHGSTIFTNPRLEVLSTAVRNKNDMELHTVEVLNCTVTSVYRHPKSPFSFVKPVNAHLVRIVIGNLNSYIMVWDIEKPMKMIVEWRIGRLIRTRC